MIATDQHNTAEAFATTARDPKTGRVSLEVASKYGCPGPRIAFALTLSPNEARTIAGMLERAADGPTSA